MVKKKILYSLFIALLFLPLLQQVTKFYIEKPLMGDFYLKQDISFTWRNWFDGSYSKAKEEYITENYGLNNTFIRINNQVLFSLFNVSKAKNVVVGKNNYLFGSEYIDSYYGKDYMGEDQIKRDVDDIAKLNEYLKKKGKILLVIINPSKCYFYPEYMPEQKDTVPSVTNYDTYKKYLPESGVSFIDFNEWFLRIKAQSDYVLYPKTGIHWSNYAAALAADSLVKYIRTKEKYNIAGLFMDHVELSNVARNPDQDIEDGSNLLFEISKPPFAYPSVRPDTANKVKPNTLIISDSFYWNWSWYGLDTMMFKNPLMGYYCNEVYDIKKGMVKKYLSEYNMEDILNKSDLVILMGTAGKLGSFPWGFLEASKPMWNGEVVKQNGKDLNIDLINKYIEKIHHDDAWMQAIQKKAIEKNISLEIMIKEDAKWMAEQEMIKP